MFSSNKYIDMYKMCIHFFLRQLVLFEEMIDPSLHCYCLAVNIFNRNDCASKMFAANCLECYST